MSVDFNLVKTCSADAFDAMPNKLLSINMEKAIVRLRSADYEIVSDAGRLCVVKKDGVEMTLFSGGRVLVKTADEKVARERAERLYLCVIV